MKDEDFCALLLHALRYEHWLRFYFAEDPEGQETDALADNEVSMDGPAELRVPEAWLAVTRERDGGLVSILDELQHHLLTMSASRDAVFRCVAALSSSDPADPAYSDRFVSTVQTNAFLYGLNAFHGWVQELADKSEAEPAAYLDGVPLFADWEQAFHIWSARLTLQLGPDTGENPAGY